MRLEFRCGFLNTVHLKLQAAVEGFAGFYNISTVSDARSSPVPGHDLLEEDYQKHSPLLLWMQNVAAFDFLRASGPNIPASDLSIN